MDFDFNDDGTGVINKIHSRINYLARKAPRIKGASHRGERLEQIIASNIDQFFIVMSAAEPPFNNKVLDRLLATGESSHLHIKIIINKSDIQINREMDEWIKLYNVIGYHVIKTSTITGEGLEEVKALCPGNKNIFWGQSGVGKSSILNEMFPGINLGTGKISGFTGKGIHTTVTSNMIKVANDTYIIDTPGIREIEPFGIRKEDLGHYFREFKVFSAHCKFNTCTHYHEPNCAVIEAVEDKEISYERYESYLRMLETIEEDIIF